MVSLKWIEFFGETDPIEYFSEARQNIDDLIDLNSMGFTFAVENIDAKYGRVEVSHMTWSGLDGVKTTQKIDMIDCDSLQPFNLPLSNEYHKARSASASAG